MAETTLTTGQVSELLGVSARRVRALIDADKLTAERRGRDLAVLYSSVVRLIEQRKRKKDKRK